MAVFHTELLVQTLELVIKEILKLKANVVNRQTIGNADFSCTTTKSHKMCTYESFEWYVEPMLRYQLDELVHLKGNV